MSNYGVTNSGAGKVSISGSVLGKGNVVGTGNAGGGPAAADPEVKRLAAEIRDLLAAQQERLERVDELFGALAEALTELRAERPSRSRAILERIRAALERVGVVTGPVSELIAIVTALHGGSA